MVVSTKPSNNGVSADMAMAGMAGRWKKQEGAGWRKRGGRRGHYKRDGDEGSWESCERRRAEAKDGTKEWR